MLSRAIYAGLAASGVPTLMRRTQNAGVILCYHNVELPGKSPDTSGLHMSLDRFRHEMTWLRAHYDVLPLSAFLDRLSRGSVRGAASVTFDDAYVGVFDHALPVLRDVGIVPAVFVVSGAPARGQPFWWDTSAGRRASRDRDRLLTALRGDGDAILEALDPAAGTPEAIPAARMPARWDVIAQACRAGVELGVHSVSHRTLPALGDDELLEEIETSRAAIARETGTTPTVFAYPYGAWDERVRVRVREAGYRAALTLDFGLTRSHVDQWALPRVNVPSGISHAAYQAWTAGLNLREWVGG